MFDLAPLQTATTARASAGLWLGEVVATGGLIAVIFALARSGRAGLSATTVACYIGAAYWFTSSTSFANPAVTVGRMFSDTFAGIASSSTPGFVVAQLLGGLLGIGLILMLYPDVNHAAGDVITPPAVAPSRTGST
jgi:glycerol uptake facilitator-like aquaporin